MAKVSRRDFLTILSVIAGGLTLYTFGKRIDTLVPVSTQTSPHVVFSSWGQNDLHIATLNMPYSGLR